MRPSRPFAALAAALPLLAAPLSAQSAERAGFVVRLGTDTVAVERVERTANRVEGWHTTRNPMTVLRHYVATLAPDGSVQSMTYEATRVAQNQVATKATLKFDADTVTMDIDIPRDTTMHVVAEHALPYVNLSYGLMEQAFRYARQLPGDSVVVPMVGVGAPESQPATVRRVGTDTMTLAIFEPTPYRARIAEDGRLLGLQGMGTTQQVVVQRLDDADVQAVAAAWAKSEQGAQAPGPLSPLDSVKAAAGAANLSIVYSRPTRRGRTIVGGVVPFDRVWRTGANAATMFTTSADLVMNGTTIPRGSYTLWTLPTKSGAQLIINKQTGQWGTEYDEAQDLVRVPLTVTRLPEQVEQFTMKVETTPQGGVLKYAWGDTEYSVPFTVKS
jgi:hypothetical protein